MEKGLTVNKKTIIKALKVKNSKFTYHSRANKNLIKLAVSWKGLLQLGSRPHRVRNPLGFQTKRIMTPMRFYYHAVISLSMIPPI